MILKSSAELTLFADTLGVPREIGVPFSRFVSSLYQNNGVEWTVKYLKTVYTDYVRFRAGLPPVGQWYRKDADGIASGCFRPLFMLGKSKKTSFAATQLLRCYTAMISPSLTPEQWRKFKDGVQADPKPVPTGLCELVVEAGRRLKLSVEYGSPSPYYTYTPCNSKRVPDPTGRSIAEDVGWYQQHRFSKVRTGQFLIRKYQPLFSVVLPHDLDHQIDPNLPDVVGKIGLIQEPGYKLRAVANPNRVIQHALKPLGDSIYRQLRKLPWDCTYKQDKAIPAIQQQLKQCHDVFCVDLTGATDYFPLQLQEVLLRSIVKKDTLGQLNMFLNVSRLDWLIPNSSGETIRWTRGQPLGLFPSFASFALTHGVLLYALNEFRHHDMFFVLGDDVVILDEGLYHKYREALSVLACPISEAKSIVSNRLAEFGGKLISSDFVESQLKWRHVSDDNFLDVLRNIGHGAERLLRPQQRLVAKQVSMIPDFLGGLGWNPDGLPLEVRYEMYLRMQQPDRSSYLLSLSRRMSQYFETLEGVPPILWKDTFSQTFDQKVAHHVMSYLRFSEDWVPVLGTNLHTVQPDLGLPVMAGNTRSTLLQRLKLMLQGV